MRRIVGGLLLNILILGLIVLVQSASAQPASTQAAPRLEHWHTAGVGLSTPLGFNAGATYSVAVRGPVFVQASMSATKDVYITRHSVLAVGPALGLRHYSDEAMLSVSVGPTYVRGVRGVDLLAPGTLYETTSVNVIGQVLFRELNMGFELYTNVNPIRNVSGMRMIYRLGRIR